MQTDLVSQYCNRFIVIFLSIFVSLMQRVDRKLSELERRNFGKDSLIRVAVVGCGYSGVELAATVSERLEEKGIVQAINVETTICPTGTPGNREAALKVRNLDASSQTVIAWYSCWF